MSRIIAFCFLWLLIDLSARAQIKAPDELQAAATWPWDSLLAQAHLAMRNDPGLSRNLAEQALQQADSLGLPYARTQANLALGNADWHLGLYPAAFDHFLTALQGAREWQDSLALARAYDGLARVNWRFGDFPLAMKNQLQALRIYDRHADSLGLMQGYYWRGIFKAEMLDYQSARKDYDLALQLAKRSGNTQMQADLYNVIGRAWRKQGLYAEAREAHQSSLALYQALGDMRGISDYHNNVGSISRREGKLSEALDHFFEALDIQKQLQDREGLADGYNDIGTTFMQMGRYQDALHYLQEGLKLARQTGLKDDVRYACASLAATYDSLGNYQQAFAYYQLYTAIKDTLLSEQNNHQMALLEVEYDHERQLQQIENLELRTQRNRLFASLLIAGLVVLVLFGGFMGYRNRIQARHNRTLARKNQQIEQAHARSEELLLNILPKETADELRLYGRANARSHEEVSVLFSDFKGFTQIAEQLSPQELVAELHHCFEAFDHIIARYGVEKIKTIGDAYMCATGLPVSDPQHAVNMIRAALEMQAFMQDLKRQREEAGLPCFEARMGIHSGPVVAGIVGIKKFSYDIWGDTVNTAARMETCGEVGKVNISQRTYELAQGHFTFFHRGKVAAKNKGEVDMYFVENAFAEAQNHVADRDGNDL